LINDATKGIICPQLEHTKAFEVNIQPFKFKQYRPEKWSLEIQGKHLYCLPALCSANTSSRGISGYLCRNDLREDLHGKLVLVPITRQHESLEVERIAKMGALGAIIFQTNGPVIASRVKYPVSSIPCVSVHSDVGLSLWRENRNSKINARMLVRAERRIAIGSNIFATPNANTPRGLFVAHRDSRIFSPGAIDNASGAAQVLLSAQVRKKPRHALLFTDAEEYGLLGAESFVDTYQELASNINVINFDSVGSGRLCLVSKSRAGRLSVQLNSKIRSIGMSAGIRLENIRTVRGSDSDTFMERGFRASWIRAYPSPTATTIDDTWRHVDERTLNQAYRLLKSLVAHFAKA
jgi:hypothetical protein